MEKILNALTVLMGLFVVYEKFDEIRNSKGDREYAQDRLQQERAQNLSLVPTLTGLQESYAQLLSQYLDLKNQLDVLDSSPDPEYDEARLRDYIEILERKVNMLQEENADLLNYVGAQIDDGEVEDEQA